MEYVPDMKEHAPEKEACTLPDMEHVVDPAGATFNMPVLFSTFCTKNYEIMHKHWLHCYYNKSRIYGTMLRL